MNFRSLLNFDKMITPVIIKILFYIGIALAIICGIVVLLSGTISAFRQDRVGLAIGGLLGGPLVVVLGILISRVYSELLIVVFEIHQNLVEIKNKMVDSK